MKREIFKVEETIATIISDEEFIAGNVASKKFS